MDDSSFTSGGSDKDVDGRIGAVPAANSASGAESIIVVYIMGYESDRWTTAVSQCSVALDIGPGNFRNTRYSMWRRQTDDVSSTTVTCNTNSFDTADATLYGVV